MSVEVAKFDKVGTFETPLIKDEPSLAVRTWQDATKALKRVGKITELHDERHVCR